MAPSKRKSKSGDAKKSKNKAKDQKPPSLKTGRVKKAKNNKTVKERAKSGNLMKQIKEKLKDFVPKPKSEDVTAATEVKVKQFKKKKKGSPVKSQDKTGSNVQAKTEKKNKQKTNRGNDDVPDSKPKPKITHQLLFVSKQKRKFNKHPEMEEASKPQIYTGLSRKQRRTLPLHERMHEKLMSARFRYLNEQMYTNTGTEAKSYFESDPEAYNAYHEGYRQQVTRWPINPVDVIINQIKKLPANFVIADFGCGEAKLAKSVSQKVHSFDLVAVDESVTACDMAHVPLDNRSVDVVVFCLSLMGTNLKDFLTEANRVLKIGGLLKIAEVESRFENIKQFCQSLQGFGFKEVVLDKSKDLFYFLETTKEKNLFVKKKLPEIVLQPCLYKKR